MRHVTKFGLFFFLGAIGKGLLAGLGRERNMTSCLSEKDNPSVVWRRAGGADRGGDQ